MATLTSYVEPHDRLEFDVAPISHTFETFPASERMYSLMNHELIHEVQGDIANEQDRRWRRFFLGKVGLRNRSIPNRCCIAISRCRATRRLAGTQKGMLFSLRLGWRVDSGVRKVATTKWCSGRWCATMPISTIHLGSSRKLKRISFQGSANAYLYGARFASWLAYRLFA